MIYKHEGACTPQQRLCRQLPELPGGAFRACTPGWQPWVLFCFYILGGNGAGALPSVVYARACPVEWVVSDIALDNSIATVNKMYVLHVYMYVCMYVYSGTSR